MAENDDTPKPAFELTTLEGYEATPEQRARLEAFAEAAAAELSSPDYPTRLIEAEHARREPIIRGALAGALPGKLRVAAERYIWAADQYRAALARSDTSWIPALAAEREGAWRDLFQQIELTRDRTAGNAASARARSQTAKERRDAIKRLVAGLPEHDRRNAPAALAALNRIRDKPADSDGEALKLISEALGDKEGEALKLIRAALREVEAAAR